jgi:iron complex transport system substrate-binding protein
MTRRFPFLALFLLALLAVLPAAAQQATTESTPESTPESGATDTFPVTVAHQFGTTTIEAEPQRIVAIGYTEQDFLLALGITPVAVRYWYGEEDAILPWAEDRVEGEAPVVLNMPFGSLNYEAILALQPDLISAVTSGITQEEYDLLSAIAPTIAQSDEYINFGMPWQDVTTLIGAAVGRSAQAEALVAEVEGLFEAARAANPQFAGKTIAVSYYFDNTFGIYTAQDSRGRFFTELGFVVPDALVEAAGDQFFTNLSAERIDLLDQDLIAVVNLQFIEGGRETLEAEPLFSRLNAAAEGRVVYLDEAAENALGFSSPLSLAFALEAALPQLEAIFPPAETAAASGAAASLVCEAGFRAIVDTRGEVCIPVDPQRIAVIDLDVLILMRLLGIQPVAHVDAWYQAWLGSSPEWEGGEAFVSGSIDVGETVNVERVLAAQPDLIITNMEEGYESLSAIAPTVYFDIYATDSASWADFTRYYGDILNARETTDAFIAQTDARIAALGDALDAAGDPTVSVFFYSEFGLLVGAPYFSYNQVLAQAGAQRPEGQTQDRETFDSINEIYWAFLSEEQIATLDADKLLIMLLQTEEGLVFAQPFIEGIETHPLWGALDAVQNERFAFVPYDQWISFDLYSINKTIDQLFERVLEQDPAQAAPNPFLAAS